MLVSFIGVGFTFNALMHPTRGAINVALAAIGIDGPGWLTDPSLALYSVALVDLWKGVGLATLIYIAGLATISPDFYEAARIDGATRTQMFWRVTVPLVRPATVTVVTLSLIGGLRSFDLIWAMTRGGPGFLLGRARERDLQAVPGRLLRAVHRRQRHPLPADRRHRRAADRMVQPPGARPVTRRQYLLGFAALLVTFVVFVVPFIFVILTAVKSKAEAARLAFSWPTEWHLLENLVEVVQTRDYMLLLAYFNSTVITLGAVAILVITGAMIGYVLQRRPSGWSKVIYGFVLAGLIIPPAVVPTIWVLQELHLFKTLHGMVLIQVAYGLAFTVLLYRSFVATIPRDLDEAARIDGAKPWQIFFRVILPLLRPVTVTVIVVQSIAIFNDFTHPLYYLPGRENVTVQLTLYNFQSQFSSQMNLLFMNVLLVTIPPLIVYVFFNRQIVAGMTAGAVKG